MNRRVALVLPLVLAACADPPPSGSVAEIAGKAAGSLHGDAAVELKDPWKTADNMAGKTGQAGGVGGAAELKDPFARSPEAPAMESPTSDLKDPFAGERAAGAKAPVSAPAPSPSPKRSAGGGDLYDPFGGPRGEPVDLRPVGGVPAAIRDPFEVGAGRGGGSAEAKGEGEVEGEAKGE